MLATATLSIVMRRAALIAALLALAATGCGASQTPESANEFKGEQAAVAEVVDQLAAAGKARDAGEDLRRDPLQAARHRAQVGRWGLRDRDGPGDRRRQRLQPQVRSVKVNGTTATAQVRQGDSGENATFTFVKEPGGWRASALGTGS